jgi:hypothetical protein
LEKHRGYMGVKAALHTKVDKYLTRDKGDPLENLRKAEHCLRLLIDFYTRSYCEGEESEAEKESGC